MSVGTQTKHPRTAPASSRVNLIADYRAKLMASARIVDKRVLGYALVMQKPKEDVLQRLADRYFAEAKPSEPELTPMQKRMQSGSF